MFSNIRVVMVNTSLPANIGAAARALKTMGFAQLRLVNPCAFDTGIANDRGPAYQLAMYSHDILENAGGHFDPHLVQVMSSVFTELEDLQLTMADRAEPFTLSPQHD